MELKYIVISVVIGLGLATWLGVEIYKLIKEIKRRRHAKVSLVDDNENKKEVKK